MASRGPLLVLVALAAGCATPKPPTFPSGPGTPFPEFASAYANATASCAHVSTFTASLALSGKAGRTKLRGRIDAGFAAPARARLEGVAPFGRPVFVLTADGDRGTLVLPRDERVLADAPPAAIVEALAGVALTPDALRRVVSGCGLSTGEPREGARHGGDLASIALGDGAVFLRRAGDAWQMAGARRDTLTVAYADYANGRPSTVRLVAEAAGAVSADLTLRLSQVEINTTIDPKVFQADIPEGADPLTLDELRSAGPLGAAKQD
jgi:outer membrane lipoprotein-sorting protein